MGAWGLGNFENDTALDWLADFEQQPTIIQLEQTIDQVFVEEYLDSDLSTEALAAIEIVAAIRNKPCPGFPETDMEAIGKLSTSLNDELIQKSLLAIERILLPEENELYELWAEAEKPDAWVAVQENLIRRLY
jgi:hypothetical protein